MSRLLYPLSTFAPIVGLELPPITGLSFATFLGNGTINSKDSTNIAPGGGAFTNLGTGPVNSLNYVTVQAPGAGIQTAMPDGGDPFTVVWAMRPSPSGRFATPMQFTSSPQTSILHLWVSGVPTARCANGNMVLASGNCDIPMATTGWQLLAWVAKIGKPTAGYNLTTGQTANSPNPVVNTTRPIAGNWLIGGNAGSYTDVVDIAFALGATSEMNATDLNTLANALRYPLRDREIYI